MWQMVSLSQLTRCSLVQKQNLHKLRMTFVQMIHTNNHTVILSIETQMSLFSVKLNKEAFAPVFLRFTGHEIGQRVNAMTSSMTPILNFTKIILFPKDVSIFS